MTDKHPDPTHIRLAKRVAEQLNCSRSTAEQFIEGGFVSVDGQLEEAPGARVRPDQVVTVAPDASLLELTPVTLLLHKPAGAEPWPQPQTHSDADRSGVQVLRKHFRDLQVMAPLRADGAGLVVFTQDWRVQRKLAEDAALLEHEVMADVAGPVDGATLQRLRDGLPLQGQRLPSVRASVSSAAEGRTRLRLAFKGMDPGLLAAACAAAGLPLQSFTRQRLGRVALGGLAPGQWRYLLSSERF
mgnify:CR=1 FL=1